MSYQVLARKWRPKKFSEMVGQEHVRQALINGLDHDRLHHAFLFTGTRGVGKTTIARIFAKSLNCLKGVSSEPCGECDACVSIDEGRFVDLIEVDAASRTGVDDMRELLDNVQYAPSSGRYKVYLIDEVHMLSIHSFNALLKTLEEPPPHIKFLLATTDPQKLPITVLSRCLQFNLKRMELDQIEQQVRHILDVEQVKRDEMSIRLIARGADGSMRDALSLLDQALAYSGGHLQEDEVAAMLGTVDQKFIQRLVQCLVDENAQEMMAAVADLASIAPDFLAILDHVNSTLHRIAVAQMTPGLVDENRRDAEQIKQWADQLSAERVQLLYQLGLHAKRDMSFAPDPRTGLEMAVLRMVLFQLDTDSPSSPQTASQAGPVTTNEAGIAANQTASSNPTTEKALSAAPKKEPQRENWGELAGQLDLSGPAKQLALYCQLEDMSLDRCLLSLDSSASYLCTERSNSKVQEALSAYLGREIQIKFKMQAEMSEPTPASDLEQKSIKNEQTLEQSVLEDPDLIKLQNELGARVVPNTLKPRTN